MNTEIAIIPIAELPILSAHHDGDVLIPMKQLSETVGLGWKAQHERIHNTPILAEGIRIIRIPSASGGLQETLCLPIKLAYVWLVTVPVGHIRHPQTRQRVDLLQRESFDAMYNYWSRGMAVNPRALAMRNVTRRDMIATAERLRTETDPHFHAFWLALHKQDCEAAGVPLPREGAFPIQPGLFDGAVQ